MHTWLEPVYTGGGGGGGSKQGIHGQVQYIRGAGPVNKAHMVRTST